MASIVDAGDNRFAGQNRDEIKAEDFGRFWGRISDEEERI
jgi:hypothetical protein